MTVRKSDYFRYFPLFPELPRWGLGVTAAGFTRIPPSSSYPPDQHPENHQFDWEHGRVLDALQIVLVSAGRGWLETRASGELRIEAGTAFLLFPGTWHRYRPDPETGWEESWIEVQGPVVESLLATDSISGKSLLRHDAIATGLGEVLDSIHRLARVETVGFQPELSAAAMQALAICARPDSETLRISSLQQAVLESVQYLNKHHAESVNVEELAKHLGVAYSHFRRAFRENTGFAPWQYVIQLRLAQSRRLLASSSMKLDDVAARVGFSSGFHLSLAFKKIHGVSPDHWRKSLATKD
ncbi:MAG: AraC family transcriptional regulator [Luteolibacter sp.]